MKLICVRREDQSWVYMEESRVLTPWCYMSCSLFIRAVFMLIMLYAAFCHLSCFKLIIQVIYDIVFWICHWITFKWPLELETCVLKFSEHVFFTEMTYAFRNVFTKKVSYITFTTFWLVIMQVNVYLRQISTQCKEFVVFVCMFLLTDFI